MCVLPIAAGALGTAAQEVEEKKTSAREKIQPLEKKQQQNAKLRFGLFHILCISKWPFLRIKVHIMPLCVAFFELRFFRI